MSYKNCLQLYNILVNKKEKFAIKLKIISDLCSQKTITKILPDMTNIYGFSGHL